MALTVACPGWRQQTKLMPPQQPTEATREGETAHAVAAAMAAGLRPTTDDEGVTQEMIDDAWLWVEALEGYPAKIETPVPIRRIHMTKCWGTPDAWQWSPETRILRVADYKYGHAFVDEFENWQLLAYAAGLVDLVGIDDRDTDVRLQLTVVQPRFYGGEPIRTWSISLPELWPYLERMQEAVREAETPGARTTSGTHCVYCPARATCKTLQKTIANAVDFAERADPMLSTPDDIGRELWLVQEFIKRLEARATGLEALAEGHIRAGRRVPYFNLEQTVGRLAWVVPPDVVEMTANLAGKTAYRPRELITPTQARERKILDARVMSAYADRPLGKFKLVPDSTKTARRFTQ